MVDVSGTFSEGKRQFGLIAAVLLLAFTLLSGAANAGLVRSGTTTQPAVQDGADGLVVVAMTSIQGGSPYVPGTVRLADNGSLLFLGGSVGGDWLIPYDPLDCECRYEFFTDEIIHFEKQMPYGPYAPEIGRVVEWVIEGNGQTFVFAVGPDGFINELIPDGVMTQPAYGDGTFEFGGGTLCCLPYDPIYEAHVRVTYTAADGYLFAIGRGRTIDGDEAIEIYGSSLTLDGPGVGVMFVDVPEPGTLGLLGLGLVTLGITARRRRRRNARGRLIRDQG